MPLFAPLAARNGAHLGEVPQREVGERPTRLPQLVERCLLVSIVVILAYIHDHTRIST